MAESENSASGRNWVEDRGVVVHEIKRLTTEVEALKKGFNDLSLNILNQTTELKIEIATLKTKTNIWSGGVAMVVGTITAALMSMLMKK